MNEEEQQTLEVNPQRLNFQTSQETQAIIKLLSEAVIGKLITYEEIINAAGGNVIYGIDPLRGALNTAERYLQKEKNFVFDKVRGVGIQRLLDDQKIRKGKAKMTSARRISRTAGKIVACADFQNLDSDQRKEAVCLQAQLGAIQLATSSKSQHTIMQQLEQNKQIDLASTIELFKGK
jgi:hypothetical protein